MNPFTDFDPETASLQVVLAFGYTPQILKNKIDRRVHTGLLFVKKGSYTYHFASGSFTAPAGSVIYLPPDSIPYQYTVSAEPDGYAAQTAQIELDVISRPTGCPIAYSDAPMLWLTDVPHLAPLFDALTQKSTEHTALNRYANLLALLSSCVKACESPKKDHPAIQPAISYLEKHFTEAFSIDHLAKLCHLSTVQLRRYFHQIIGCSPLQYKNMLRLAAARKLLQSDELRIAQIAELLGFADIYAFSHFFKTNTGVSPAEYRHSKP